MKNPISPGPPDHRVGKMGTWKQALSQRCVVYVYLVWIYFILDDVFYLSVT